MRAKDNNHLIPSPDDAVTRDSSSVYCIKRSVSYRRGKKKPKWVLYWVAHHPQGFRAVNEPRGRTSWTSFFFYLWRDVGAGRCRKQLIRPVISIFIISNSAKLSRRTVTAITHFPTCRAVWNWKFRIDIPHGEPTDDTAHGANDDVAYCSPRQRDAPTLE